MYTLLHELASSMYHACHFGFPDFEYECIVDWKTKKKGKKKRRPELHDIKNVEMFHQTWGSTALGFGGIGGAAMTTASVIIVFFQCQACVYFQGRFAYLIKRPNQEFYDDIAKRSMKDVSAQARYENKDE